MFKQGLKHGAIVLVITFIAAIISMLSRDEKIVEIVVDSTVIISWLTIGYFYKKNHGPLVTLTPDAAVVKRIWGYILGVGVIWGPAKLLLIGFPIPEAPIYLNMLVAVIAVPFSGAAVLGAVIVGGFFYRGETNASNKSLNQTGANDAPPG